jgi:hypothetical protein
MSQRPTETPEWAATGNQSTPSAGRKSSGWLGATATTPGDKPPAQEFNWFWALVTRWLTWALGYGAQRLDSYARATGYGSPLLQSPPQCEDNEAFILDDYSDTNPAFDHAFTANPAGIISGVASDGRFLFISVNLGADSDIAVFDPLTGASWDGSYLPLTGDNIYHLSGSGRHLAVARDVGGARGARVYRAIDAVESVASAMTVAGTPTSVDCVGAGLIVVDGSGGYAFHATMTTAAHTGNHGAALEDCCGFDDRAVVVGNHTAGVTSRGFDFATGAAMWTANRSGANATCVCTDGDFLYEGGAADGAGDIIVVRDLYSGTKQGGAVAGGVLPNAVAVDDRYLYVGQSTELYVLDKRSLWVVKVITVGATVQHIAVDGRCVFVATSNDVFAYRRNELPRTMVYIDPQDTAGVDTLLSNNRKPIHGLILPLGGR